MPVGAYGLLVAKAVPWSRKQPVILKSPPPWYKNRNALSAPQLKACLALARAATGAYGTRGKIPYKGVSMPAVAVKVAGAVPKGASVHGGLSRSDRASRAHSAAGASIAGLESLLTQKGAVAGPIA
jgi:hypothetical protein